MTLIWPNEDPRAVRWGYDVVCNADETGFKNINYDSSQYNYINLIYIIIDLILNKIFKLNNPILFGKHLNLKINKKERFNTIF
jgi:hypothetical protein